MPARRISCRVHLPDSLRQKKCPLSSGRLIMEYPYNRLIGAYRGFVVVAIFSLLFGSIQTTPPLYSSSVKRTLSKGVEETTGLSLCQPKEIQPISGQVTSLKVFLQQNNLTKRTGFIAFVNSHGPKKSLHEMNDILGRTKASPISQTSPRGAVSAGHENPIYYTADLHKARYRFLKEKFPGELGEFYLKGGEFKFAENEVKKNGPPERTLRSFWESRVWNPEGNEFEGEDHFHEFVGWLQKNKSYWRNEEMNIDESKLYNLQKLYEGVLEWQHERGQLSNWKSDGKVSLTSAAQELVELDLYPLTTQAYNNDPGVQLHNFKEVTSKGFSHPPEDMNNFTQWLGRKHHHSVKIDEGESYSLECLIMNYISWIDEEFLKKNPNHMVSKGIKEIGPDRVFDELLPVYHKPEHVHSSIAEILESGDEVDIYASTHNGKNDEKLSELSASELNAKWKRFTERNFSRKRARISNYL